MQEEVTDEFIKPIVVSESGNPLSGRIKEKDVGIFFNFRADRARELSYVLSEKDFKEFDRGNNLTIHLVNMTQYDEKLKPQWLSHRASLKISCLRFFKERFETVTHCRD